LRGLRPSPSWYERAVSHPPSASAPRPGSVALALGVAVATVSSAALLIRSSAADAVTIALWRLTWATVILAPWSLRAARRELPSLPRRELRLVVLAGVVLALHFGAWFVSFARSSPWATSVAASSTLVVLHPALVALATPWLFGQTVPRRARWGIALSLLGAAIIALGDASAQGRNALIGDLLALLGAAGGAAYFLLGARLRATLSLRAYLLPVYATAALTLGALAALSGSALWVSSWREHAIFLALAAGPMVLGHGLLNWSLRWVPAWAVSASILAEPVSASALVLAVRGERPPWSAVAGALPVLAGLFLIATAARQKEPA